MSKRLHWIAPFAVCVVLLGCGKPEPARSEPNEEPTEATAEEAAAPSNVITLSAEKAREGGIETVLARAVPMQAELKVAGTVTSTAKGRALVTPPVSGKILRLLVAPGDTVREGQQIAVIESPELTQAYSAIAEADRARIAAEADVRRASSERDLARAHLRTAQAQLERQHQLAKAGVFSQPSLQAAQREVSDAKADLESAQQDEAVHRVQLDRAERLYKQELISRTDLEQAQLAVSQDVVRRQREEQRVGSAGETLAREQIIASKGLLTAREIQAAEAEARSAKLEVQRATIVVDASRSSLAGAKQAVSNASASYAAVRGTGNLASKGMLTLTSPLRGTVTERKATVGQAVERASELFEIENLDTVWVTANVPEKAVSAVAVGARVKITAAAYPNGTFTGVVQLLGNHLDPKTRTVPVQCLVNNPGGSLREEMFAVVLLGVGASSTALAVPDTAIDRHGEESVVFVADGEKYEKRKVTVGRSAGGYTEILRGLKAGEKVVKAGLFVVESESRKDELKGEE